MNKQRRKALEKINTDLENIKSELEGHADKILSKEKIEELVGKIADGRSQLETLRDEEQDYYDNMPEGLQAGDKGSNAEEAIGNLDEAVTHTEEAEGLAFSEDEEEYASAIEEAANNLESAIDLINSATGG